MSFLQICMHLKEAIAKNKLKEFARDHGKKYPQASKVHFDKVIRIGQFAFGFDEIAGVFAGKIRQETTIKLKCIANWLKIKV